MNYKTILAFFKRQLDLLCDEPEDEAWQSYKDQWQDVLDEFCERNLAPVHREARTVQILDKNGEIKEIVIFRPIGEDRYEIRKDSAIDLAQHLCFLQNFYLDALYAARKGGKDK